MFSKHEKAFSASRSKKLPNSNFICGDDTVLSQSPRTNILLVPRLSPIDVSREPLTFLKPFGYVPTVLVNASKIIETHITERELFQIQGSMEKVEYLNHVLGRQRLTMPRNTSVHDVAEVVKVYLSRMSSEIIPDDIMTRLINIHQGGTYADYFRVIHKFHGLMPNICPSVHFVLHLLNKVAQHSSQNGMDARKLATIFVLDILKPLSQTEDNEDFKKNRLRRVQRLPYNIMAIEYLIQNANIFEMALPVKENMDSAERNNNWEAKPDEIEIEPDLSPIKKEGSVVVPHFKVTNSVTSRETWASIQSSTPKDKQGKRSSRLNFGRTSPQRPFPKAPSERGLSSSSKYKKWKEKPNFSSLNIKNQDNHNSTLDKTDPKLILNGSLPQAIETPPKKEYMYEESGSPIKSCKDKEKLSYQGFRDTCRQTSKTKENNQKTKQSSSYLRKRIRSHSDSAKDMAEFKLPQRFKLTKRGKSKEGKSKNTGSKLFKNDEELLPWGGVATESEDVSLIVQSTQNPKTFQFLDKYHNTTGTQLADKVGVEPNLTPHHEHHRKQHRWNKNKCSSARRKTSNNNIRTASRSASRNRRKQKKPIQPNQSVEKSALYEFNKVFHSETPVETERVEIQQEDKDDSPVAINEEPVQIKTPSPLRPQLAKPNVKKKGCVNVVGKRPPLRPRYDSLQKDSNDYHLHWGNILEWLCDIVLIIIAAVCAIYIYHLLVI